MANDETSATFDDGGARFFAVSTAAIAVVTLGGAVREVNRAWTARFGATKRGAALSERIANEDRPALARAIDDLRGGHGTELVLRFVRDDEATAWFTCELSAEPGANTFYFAARPVHSARSLPDERTARVHEALVRALDETPAFGLYMVSDDSSYPSYANAEAGRIWEIEDFPSKVRDGSLSRDVVRKHVESMIARRPTGNDGDDASSVGREFSFVLHNGRTVLWLVTPVIAEDGRPMGQLYVSKDITSRRETESSMALALERRNRSEAEFRRLLEHVPDGIVVMREGKFAFANAAAARILGYDRAEDLIGVHFAAIVRPEELTSSVERVRLMTGDAPPPRTLRPMVRRDGTTVYAETLGFQTEFDGAPATLVIAHDVTEERRLEAQMRQAERLASLGTLSATIAHEINNPLTYILLNLQATRRWLGQLAETTPSPILLRALQLIDQSLEGSERVRVIVKGLRGFAHSDDSDLTLVDVRAVFDSVIPMAEHEIRQRARLVRSYGEVPLVRANAARLAQVFLNLLVNAAHAIPERAFEQQEIRIEILSESAGEVVVTVRDSGEGMPASVRDRIFEPFFTTKAPGVGTGLGLSLCLGIVHALGGSIDVESEIGLGSTFRVTLPAGSPDVVTGSSSAVIPTIPRARILVVDDEPRIAERLGDLLKGHDVVIATGGTEALAQLRARTFDVVFCDLMMPDVKGTDVFEAMSREQPSLSARFIFMTAGAYTPSARAVLDRVSNPRLDKPFSETQVQQVLALVLSSPDPMLTGSGRPPA